ncbi:MAG: hypothetical protein IT441_08420, partial [Phycisphaeraceae bacterium]|nr:hypothetical protein [Phycisphaeraceae bacterium]
VFPLACPILVQNKDEKAVITPLAMIQARSLWAERSLDPDALAHAKFDPNMSAPAEGFIVGAAYEKEGHRLIVFSDPYFANDQITTYGQIAGVGGSAGLADLVGATFPGNAELFVNSVLWLADLPQLIAPSPRSQDIRRIEPMGDGMLTGLRWGILLGLPLACLATGTGVWWVRRRG